MTQGAYRVAPAPSADPAAAAEPATAAPAPADSPTWTAHASTTRGMIGRPAAHGATVSRPAATATPTAQAQATGLATTALPDVEARVAGSLPDPPAPGTVYGRPVADRTGKVLSGRMARLRIGWHTASMSALPLVGVSVTGTGLVLGTDARQRAVPVRLFRPEPTRAALLSGDWLAALLVFRALALGAYVNVWTDDPLKWRGLGERATGNSGRVVVNAEHAGLPPAGPQQPVLSVTDDGSIGAGDGAARAWLTDLVVLRRLDQRAIPVLQESDLVIAQRLGEAEAAVVASALRSPFAALAGLTQIDDSTVCLLSAPEPTYLRVDPTDIERGHLGAARR